MKLWGSRMGKPINSLFEQLNASYSFDVRLYREDIDASMAWAGELESAGVLTPAERGQIQKGLRSVLSEFESGEFIPGPQDEDIHTAVERRLTELIGPVAGKLHSGRSRNDQVATDFRLWIMRACRSLEGSVSELGSSLHDSAEAHRDVPMPGYTHLQPAQPVTWGHWAMSHAWPLLRDRRRLAEARRSAAVLPLGSGALAGTPLPIDRERLARALGFTEVSRNSMDGVADRDFVLEFLFACTVLGLHLSRLAEQLILFSTHEFGFLEVDDAFATGSSLMPQKKNPDALELARGKAGRLIGHLAGLLTTLKALPSAYDKDLQEDKEPAFDAFDTLSLLLPVLAALIDSLQLRPERMGAAIPPSALATDLADLLAAKGVPFRKAHDLVGQAVRKALEAGVELQDLPADDLRRISPLLPDSVGETFDVGRSLARRSAVGGTNPQALQAQLAELKAALLKREP